MKRSTAYFCAECGHEEAKWAGRCAACGAWNSMTEQPKEIPVKTRGLGADAASRTGVAVAPARLADIVAGEEARLPTGIGELDRVLGGGLVSGSLSLVSGEPGIGKSTLMMQLCGKLSRFYKVLYVSGEESPRQLRLRGERLNVDDMFVLSQTELDDLLASVTAAKPDVLVVDSIQTLYRASLSSLPGSVAQVRECTLALMRLAKDTGVTVFVVGHINKEGAIAGPKVLEHMVDCVLYFEGDRHYAYRILRAAKNRFGSTQEIGMFEMDGNGLREIPNPSELLLAGRPLRVPGSCVACVMEGSRPVLGEIQALLTETKFSAPRRMTNGTDLNRALLLLAVLERRAGMYVGNQDAYINVVGGLRVAEPACDLPIVLALASSFRDRPLPPDLAAFGEVGLTGELRGVSHTTQRISEIARLGFRRCVLPRQGSRGLPLPEGMEMLAVKNIGQAFEMIWG